MLNLTTLGWAGGSAAKAVVNAGAGEAVSNGDLPTAILIVVTIGIVTVFFGMMLCVYRLLRGPHLADRVLAGDTLSLHVVALVILLAVRLQTEMFFDAALVVAIIGFASTLAFAQYIGSQRAEHRSEAERSDAEQAEVE